MINVIVLGAGNVATHLIKSMLTNPMIKLVQVYNHNLKNIAYLEGKTVITDAINALKEADIYIIAIPDNHISELEKQFSVANKLVVHTSGSTGLAELTNNTNTGVLYPLQSFSKHQNLDVSKVPFCIETSVASDFDLLEKLATSLTKKVYHVNSEQRKSLHLAAVFVNNFVNHLNQIGSEICKTNNVPFEILQPLIQETAKKITHISPLEAQTGPAKRNDTKTINKHLAMLSLDQREIYKLLTKNIYHTHGKKL